MTWLIGEILVYLIAAAIIGLIVGWLLGRIRRRKRFDARVEAAVAERLGVETDSDGATLPGATASREHRGDGPGAPIGAVVGSGAEPGDDSVGTATGETIDLTEYETAIAERDATIEQLRAELAPHRTDDLKLIHGIGPVFERSLNSMGYTTYDQVAAWSEEDLRKVAAEIDLFPDRIVRDEWIEQASALALRKASPVTPPSITVDDDPTAYAPPLDEDRVDLDDPDELNDAFDDDGVGATDHLLDAGESLETPDVDLADFPPPDGAAVHEGDQLEVPDDESGVADALDVESSNAVADLAEGDDLAEGLDPGDDAAADFADAVELDADFDADVPSAFEAAADEAAAAEAAAREAAPGAASEGDAFDRFFGDPQTPGGADDPAADGEAGSRDVT